MRTMRTVPEPDQEDPREVQARLQAFLKDVDPALLESLRRDERRRRRKLVLLAITGGLVMGSVIATIALMLLAPQAAVPAKQADQALALSSEGWQLWQAGKFDKAADKFEQSLKLDPTSANALNGLGWAKLNGGDAPAAKEAFEKCVKIQKDHAGALNGLGQMAFADRDYAAAERHWLAAVKDAPGDAPAAAVGLAKLYLLQGKFDEAVKYAQAAADSPGADPSIQQLLGAAKAKQLDPQLKAAIEPPPSGAGAAVRGWALLNQGKLNQAKEAFEAGVAKDPNNFAARNGLGFALINLGKPAEAKPHFEQCLKLQPGAPGPTNGLAICLKAEGKVDEAITLWEKMAAQPPTPNAATTGLATTYCERKQYAKALPYLEQLTKAMPNHAAFKEMLEKAKAGADEK